MMTVIKRRDGTEFAMQPYRELLSPKKSALLKKEIRLLADNNGDYVRLFRQPDGQYEAVFSRVSGYLLGEAIWRYLGRPEDLIYCEVLPGADQALLVVVRNGKVHLDTFVPKETLHDEFVALAAGYSQYVIYIYGEVPLAEMPEENKFSFDKTFVKSFNELEKPLFDIVPVDNTLQLLTLNDAIHSQRLGNDTPPWVIWTFSLTILLIIFSWYDNNHKMNKPAPVAKPETRTLYQTLLSSPDPGEQIARLSKSLLIAYGLPGWLPFRVTFDGNDMRMRLHSLGGTIAMLSQELKTAPSATLNLLPEGAEISVPINGKSRETSAEMRDTQNTLGLIIDRMMRILPNKSVTILASSTRENFKATQLAINVEKISPSVLELVGHYLQGLPLQLNNSDFTYTDGLISGQINLTVLGK